MKFTIGRDILKGTDLPFDRETCERTLERFFSYEKPVRTAYSGDGRRMNHFCLGADPEFMFLGGYREVVHATHLNLKAGLAFGADQNDRLVELRAAPSRSAVDVLASVLAELRWLYRFLGADNRAFTWNAHAFAHGDGMGGHVHFGRKRPQREDEVRGLDGLAKVMRACNLFDSTGWERRSRGDQFNQMYGQYGDIREQKHGYEYRTLPTWLDSPKLAFLVLTLSKLVVIDPDVTAEWGVGHLQGWHLLQGLAKYYMGRDDDALLLYSMMERPEPFMFQGGDFRSRWGLTGDTKTLAANAVIPAVIEHTVDDMQDLLKHLIDDQPLVMRETEANFRDQIPTGYLWVPNTLEYRRRPNIGDLFYDMVGHRDRLFNWDFDNRGCQIYTPIGYDATALRKIATGIDVRTYGDRFSVRVGLEWRKGEQLSHLRRVLYSGLLPLWKVDDVTEDSFKQWLDTQAPVAKPVKKAHKYAGLLKGMR